MSRLGILGGGWAGLLCAYEIKKIIPDANIEIIEKQDEANLGGLLRSEIIDGLTFDTGGPHILFSKNKEILSETVSLLGDNVRTQFRKSFIHYSGRLLPYPFENGISELDREERAKFGTGLIKSMLNMARTPDWVPSNFKEWIYGFFGDEMGKKYLEPYNRKIWKRDPADIDSDWVFAPGRLPFPDIEKLVQSVAGIPTTGYAEQANFYYPKKGGINSLYNGLLKRVLELGVKLRTGVNVTSLSKNEVEWKVNEAHTYDKIFSTLPLNEVGKVIEMPSSISRDAESLDFNRVIVTGLAFNKNGPDQHALYVPESGINFHRYTWMSSLTSDTPKGKSNTISEVTVPRSDPLDIEENKQKTIDGFVKLGVIRSEDEVILSKVWEHKYGYPVYTKGNRAKTKHVLDYLESIGVSSVGRWGSWEYWNTDKVFEAVKKQVSAHL